MTLLKATVMTLVHVHFTILGCNTLRISVEKKTDKEMRWWPYLTTVIRKKLYIIYYQCNKVANVLIEQSDGGWDTVLQN